VNQTFAEMMVQNNVIAVENTTIRALLQQQQDDFNEYLDDQQTCMTNADQNKSTYLHAVEVELEELIAIARPDVRSAVNFDDYHGYQHEARTDDPTASSLVETEASSKAGAKATSMVKRATSFLESGAVMDMEMGAEQCHRFTSLLEKANAKLKIRSEVPDCHEERVKLQEAFNASYLGLAALYDQRAREIESDRAFCLSKAEYDYKEGVEGADGIDAQIQAAAQRIHTAQHVIGVMEPRLHDLEHAVRTVREYIESIKETCTIDDSVTDHLSNIRHLIEKISECPGLNDFTISIPHWSPARIATPSPTPWPIYGPLRGPRSFYLVPVTPNDVV